MSVPQNFQIAEQRPLSVTSTSQTVNFTNANAAAYPDCMITNYGTKGCQVNFGGSGVTAVATASAGGTTQGYCPGGSIIVLRKLGATSVAAICDSSDTTTVTFHIGLGQ